MTLLPFDDPDDLQSVVSESLACSPIYTHLDVCIKADPEIEALRRRIPSHQPRAVLFFTLVNYLLRCYPDPLAAFYPILATRLGIPVQPVEQIYPVFQAFVHTYRQEMEDLIEGGARLQTNEVARLGNLLPAFRLVYELGGYRPLAGIEIGASAGLNLNWPLYRYCYNGDLCVGDPSPVTIQCQMEDSRLLPLLIPMSEVASLKGIERHPIDLFSEQAHRWLEACIWPEELDRYPRLEAALTLARRHPPTILKGDACELLPALLADIPQEHTPMIWHSFALNQGPLHVREQIEQQILQASESSQRAIYRIALEVDSRRATRPILELFAYKDGRLLEESRLLAYCDLHGGRMQRIDLF